MRRRVSHPPRISERGNGGSANELRARIAVEAARLISESGVRDFAFAKRKAAVRLGINDDFALPKNSEVEAALREHQRLFHADDQPSTVRRLREIARTAMGFFAAFEPRLVGAVLDGSADTHSAVTLHLFSDDPDAPARFLVEKNIPYTEQDRRLRINRERADEFPVLQFEADETLIDLTIFDLDALRQAPLDRITELPMRRATLASLDLLLD